MSDAPFDSVHAALTYAFNFSEQQYPETTLAKMMRKAQEEDVGDHEIGTGRGLTGVDGAGQAGMVLAEIARAPDDHRNAVFARYCKRSRTCGHCGNRYALTEEWKAAIIGLAEFSVDHLDPKTKDGGGKRVIVDVRLRHDLVAAYFGKKANYTKLADQYGLDRHTVASYYATIAKALKTLEFAAQDQLHWKLVAAGMIAEAIAA